MNHKSRPWTSAEEALLRDHSLNGEDVLKVAGSLNRTLGAVIAKMFELGLKVPQRKAVKEKLGTTSIGAPSFSDDVDPLKLPAIEGWLKGELHPPK